MHGQCRRSMEVAMRERIRCTLGLLLLAAAGCSPGSGSGDGEAVVADGGGTAAVGGAAMQEGAIQPGAEDAVSRLRASPRHGEWAVIPAGAGDSVRAWVVYPERSDPAPVVLVVHEIYGLTHWVRAVADQLAADGFIAIAPDLLTGADVPADPSAEPDPEAAVRAIRELDPADVHRRLSAAAAWGTALPAATDRYGIIGFCWGGNVAFEHAVRAPELDASVVYYGPSPDPSSLASVRAPVLGLYAGDDARVNATVPPVQSAMRELGKVYEVRTYDGAGHGFLRQQNGRDGANRAASKAAWPETVRWLRTYLEGGG